MALRNSETNTDRRASSTTVLVTGAGGATGVSAIKTLQQTTDHDVVAVDMDPDAAGLFLVDDGRTVPAATDPGWTGAIEDVVETFDVDVVLPTVDEELGELSALDVDVPVVAPSESVVDVALDKYRTYQRLKQAGLSVPETWLASETPGLDGATFPVLAKPRFGRGSRGVEVLDGPRPLEAYLRRTEYAHDEVVIQEFVDGPEFTTSVVATRDDRLLGVVPKEAMEKQGSTVKGVTRDDERVAESCRAVHEALAPHGPMNVQQMVDEDGTPYTIEINPRFSSTSCLTVAAGVNEFDLLIRDAAGESVEAPTGFEAGVSILRYRDHLILDADDRA